jgi:hypothetical protein
MTHGRRKEAKRNKMDRKEVGEENKKGGYENKKGREVCRGLCGLE